jgi:signal transduction histidine kinase
MTECSGRIETAGCQRLLTISVREQKGVLTARQRARQLARFIGFDQQDQIRIATATSEIARNAIEYGRDGQAEFLIDLNTETPLFIIRVTDKGPGIVDSDAIFEGPNGSQTGMGLGLSGTRRLMDRFSLESTPGEGTTVTFAKILPANVRLNSQLVEPLSEQLVREEAENASQEIGQQSHELLVALELIHKLEAEIEKRQADTARLNQELEETNQGVVALYAELDEGASALRRADEVKTRFLSYMSHEFRTPLNSILALSDLLLGRVDGDLTAEQEKQVGFVRSASYELFEMVNDLLDIAKVEAGKIDLRVGMVEVTKVFGTLRGMMRPLAHSERVSLVLEEPPNDLLIQSDEGKISQILRNLISNALKFTEQGEIRVRVNREDSQIIFSVADTGIGIAPDDQERIFREFAQVENPVQRRVRGTGLGLPLSRKLAELIGGTLTVVSTLGTGSIFRLTLPLAIGDSRPAWKDQPSEADSSASGRLHLAEERSPGSILVIDDQEVARYIARQFLRGTRYLITEAAGGIEGLERARFDRPSLILLDINMHDRNGFEVLEDLKADPATKDIPVVLHTSVSLTEDDLLRLKGRHAAVLPKQAGNRDQAMAVIREILGEPHLFTKQ